MLVGFYAKLLSKLNKVVLSKDVYLSPTSTHLPTPCSCKITASDDNSTTQLPSPHVFLQQDVTILATPNTKSVQFNSAYTVLNINIGYIDNVSIYRIGCVMYDPNDIILKEISKEFQPSNDENMSMEIDFNKEIEEWKSVFPKIASLNVVATAIGSGYYLSSRPSKPECIKQQSKPHIKYSYSSIDDMITITCQRQGNGTGEVVLGLIAAKLDTKRFPKWLNKMIINIL